MEDTVTLLTNRALKREDREPAYALALATDPVVIRYGERV